LFGSVCDFLPADVGTVPSFFAIETLIVSHEFCTFLGVMGLSWADFVGDYCIDVHGVSSLGGGAASSSLVSLVLFDPKGLIEVCARIRTVGSSFLPFAMLFLGLLSPFFEGPGHKRVIGVGGYDGVEKSRLQSKLELFDGAMFSER
jgi:hypothetical protein